MGELHVCKAQYPMYEACAKPTVHVPVTALCRRCHCPCVPAVDSKAWTPSLDSFRVSLCSLPRAHRFCGPERPLLPSLVFFPILNGITWLTSRTSPGSLSSLSVFLATPSPCLRGLVSQTRTALWPPWATQQTDLCSVARLVAPQWQECCRFPWPLA